MKVQINLLNAAGTVCRTHTFEWDGSFAEAKANIEKVVGSPIIASMATPAEESQFAMMAMMALTAGQVLDFRGQDINGNIVDVDVKAAA